MKPFTVNDIRWNIYSNMLHYIMIRSDPITISKKLILFYAEEKERSVKEIADLEEKKPLT